MSGGSQKVVGPVAMAPMKPSRSPKKGCRQPEKQIFQARDHKDEPRPAHKCHVPHGGSMQKMFPEAQEYTAPGQSPQNPPCSR